MKLSIIHACTCTLEQNGLRYVLGKGGGIGRHDLASNEQDLADALKENKYEVLIIDHDGREEFNLSTIRQVRTSHPELHILVISEASKVYNVIQVLELGVHGYLTHECDENEIIHAIFSLGKGEKFYCNRVLDIILNKEEIGTLESDCTPTILTPRELDIVTLIAQGHTGPAIGEQLFISPHTVHTHRRNIMKKLGVNSVSELTRYALSIGLVNPN